MTRSWLRSWAIQMVLVSAAVSVVLVVPLAAPGGIPAGPRIIITGARTISDHVAVTFANTPSQTTTDVHLLAFNDLHGNLEAGGNNIYGQFAGGASYLAKAVKDRQAQYGPMQATILAGDNIGASPLANGLFHEEPIDREQSDERRLRLCRQP